MRTYLIKRFPDANTEYDYFAAAKEPDLAIDVIDEIMSSQLEERLRKAVFRLRRGKSTELAVGDEIVILVLCLDVPPKKRQAVFAEHSSRRSLQASRFS